MVCLLVSVTVLHLVTLAMLLISTLEKVGHACTTTCRVSCFLTVGVTVCSPGGCGPTRRSPTSGTTVSTTTPPTPGCVLLPVKVVNEQSRDSGPVRSGPVCLCVSVDCSLSLSLRLAPVRPGSHGSVCGLLVHLLPGLHDAALHSVHWGAFLLHRPLSGLCRYSRRFFLRASSLC